MFNMNKDKMIEKEAEFKAKRILLDIMTEAILTSESAPEHIKLRTQIMMKTKDINELLGEKIINKFCHPDVNTNVETLKKVVEYLQLVEIGFNQFIECTPLVEDAEGEAVNGN